MMNPPLFKVDNNIMYSEQTGNRFLLPPPIANTDITLRDLFAGMVSAGIMAGPDNYWHDPVLCAERAFEVADAMIAER